LSFPSDQSLPFDFQDNTADAIGDQIGDEPGMIHMEMGNDRAEDVLIFQPDVFHLPLIFVQRAGPASVNGRQFATQRALNKEAMSIMIPKNS
jgi:hypothetical protein